MLTLTTVVSKNKQNSFFLLKTINFQPKNLIKIHVCCFLLRNLPIFLLFKVEKKLFYFSLREIDDGKHPIEIDHDSSVPAGKRM